MAARTDVVLAPIQAIIGANQRSVGYLGIGVVDNDLSSHNEAASRKEKCPEEKKEHQTESQPRE